MESFVCSIKGFTLPIMADVNKYLEEMAPNKHKKQVDRF
jgi:hypothetical protein